MMLTITPLYAAPIALLFMYLSIRVIRYRRSERVAFGDQGDQALLRLMPRAWQLRGVCATGADPAGHGRTDGAGALGLHLAGILLVLGRVVHGLGLAHYPRVITCRVVGITATFTSYLVCLGLALF